ncbi:lipocalin family protein [Phaeobacter marinintestinus]|uniref:lipocalin family protein n=1 Tax=Falsiphaeobacter marinintestinus TaxID=1492905 RepID=UPI0011B5A57F|nr:lipocalin family protein [Phaeobacter marinintestinus]
MLRRLIAIASIFAATSAGAEGYRDTTVPMTVDTTLDLTQYLGKWYEIARFPNRFEKDCMAVTAEYSARGDGRIDVLNTCRKGAVDGPVKQAKGVARPVEAGKLEVTFVPGLSVLGFLWGDYWVLDVTGDYSVAVVGAPEGTTGWILARAAQISDTEYEAAQAVLRANGYDTDALYRVPQTKD